MVGKPRRRGSLLFPLVLVAAGIVLLLTNLGLIEGVAWRDVLRFWPVLLIVAGIDLIIGRASVANALSVLIVSCLFAAAAFVAFQWFAPDEWVTRTESVRYALQDVDSARIGIACSSCAVTIERSDEEAAMIHGSLDLRSDERLVQSVKRSNGELTYDLRSEDRLSLRLPGADRAETPWHLLIPGDLPIDFSLASDSTFDLDLRGLAVVTLDLDVGREGGEVFLSDACDTTVFVSGREVLFRVPPGVGVELSGGSSTEIDVPDDFAEVDGRVRSPDFDHAAVRATLVLRPEAGSIHIVTISSIDE